MKKYLRTILCLLLALSMVFCFAACSSSDKDEEEEEDSIAGNYVFYSMSKDDEEISADDLEEMGMDPDEFYLILKKNGTGTMSVFGEEGEIEWDDEEMIGEDGEAVEYTVKGNKLTLTIEEYTFVFKKTSKEVGVSKEQEETKNEEIEIVTTTSTTYRIYAVSAQGITVSGADLTATGYTADNTYVVLTSDNTGTLNAQNKSEEICWDTTAIWGKNDTTDRVEMTLDGDVLTLHYEEGGDLIFLKEGSSQVPDISTGTANTTSVVGRYEIYGLAKGTDSYEGSAMQEIISAMGLSSPDDYMYLELYEGGTGIMSVQGSSYDMEYDATKLWPKGNSSGAYTYTFENGKLTFSIDEFTYTFMKK